MAQGTEVAVGMRVEGTGAPLRNRSEDAPAGRRRALHLAHRCRMCAAAGQARIPIAAHAQHVQPMPLRVWLTDTST